mmetsp:Transcript_18158/g.33021  ORF Transcript_18158/g.33021 Transcript_18158/m.33021 type:complete len:731 (+) Transcript_18158:167-2359(+)|eukprot:CAMPEP_0201917512 /NCGR_PEP_ID=MMETSP0903-20130614/6888_1 /ASSEMBLY_ACC=CAM_ASM_000552 /TAXON_ID=420261 /ORGANISM="Thalassiosira antarctica, Strain CCMP982" /LENGTH=730 /DNA_ID=CAMNT_0048453589 /DNA_START=76 /DNA_END=2268 /DNA_ORIENTATION=+
MMQVPTTKKGSMSTSPKLSRARATARSSTLCIPHCDPNARLPSDPDIQAHCEIEFKEEECAITSERLDKYHATAHLGDDRSSCILTAGEMKNLWEEQKTIRRTLFLPGGTAMSAVGGSTRADKTRLDGMVEYEIPIKDPMQWALGEVEEEEEEPAVAPPEDEKEDPSSSLKHGICDVKAQLMTAKLRARVDKDNEGVLGVQSSRSMQRFNSMVGNKFMMYNMRMSSTRSIGYDFAADDEEEVKEVDVEDISYVRKPNLARIIEEYEAMQNHPKYTLRQVVLSRRFHLYAHRFRNAQYQHTLIYPTLKQPPELHSCPWLQSQIICGECKEDERVTEKQRTRTKGHRFIIAADTQFGILMDGFAMDFPNWSQEIEISRKCVAQINDMHGRNRPLYVCVCGDLVDTEGSFSGAIASWKKVMSGWERNLVFEQQVKDFKRVWAGLDPDIALVCLCGNHDVGNRPTRESINHWTSSFGDDYLSFWVNGTFNICLNNCLFSNPTGAPDLFDEQLEWMEEKLAYARENDATHIFVYGHFPWFLKHEEEGNDDLTSYSAAPAGWGPHGSSFADSYFTVPYEQRKIAMALFKKYDVTACFSGHFHQNVVAETSWGMPMIVTGPLSMNLNSEIAHELSNGETNGIGMRVVDVGERGEFTHKWSLLDDEEELYEHAMKRCMKSMEKLNECDSENEEESSMKNSGSDTLFDEVELTSVEALLWHTTRMSMGDLFSTAEHDDD